MAKIRKIYDDAIKPDGSKQVIYPVTSTRAVYTTSNVTVDKVLSEGYRFGGIVLPTDSPSITDQRVFYGASVPGVYTSFGNIAVDSGEAIFLLYDGEHWEKGIFGGAGYSTLTGFKALASIQDLPREETRFGYLINGHLYVWVGENGDTLDGLYLDCGELRGASAYEVAVRNGYRGTEQEWLNDPIHGIKGISVKSVECIHEAIEDGGTNIWRITLTNGNSTDFEVKNGNQGNSGYQGAAGELEVVNNLTDGGATAALSAEMGKAIVDLYGTYVDNPEFVKVWLDKEDRILMAIRNDGDIYFGAGVPNQVKSYIEEKISALSLDEYEAIVAFLDGLIGSDTTLKMMLDSLEERKVDKEEGKSLIDSEHADAASHIDNPEYLQATTDSEDKVLEGFKQDGTKVIGGDFNVGGNTTIKGNVAIKGNVELTSESIQSVDNPEYLKVTIDAQNKVLEAIKKDGSHYIHNVQSESIDTIKNNIKVINKKVSKISTFKKVSILGDSISTFDQDGFKIDGYSMFYPSNNDRSSDVVSVEDTWWKKVINNTGGIIEVNASCSGSTASNLTIGFSPRVPLLGNPDVIYIALGTNDSANNVPIGEFNYYAESYDLSKFAPAYIKGIKDTITLYPKAQIICIAFDMSIAYQNAIKEIANHYGLKYIYVGDISDVHPNKEEMLNVANVISGIFTTLEYHPEYSEAKIDSNGKIIAGRTPDGTAFENIGFSTPKVSIDGATIENIQDPEGRTEIKTDAEGKIISYRDSEGVVYENVGIESTEINTNTLKLSSTGLDKLQEDLINNGFKPNEIDNSLKIPKYGTTNIKTEIFYLTAYPGVNSIEDVTLVQDFEDTVANGVNRMTLYHYYYNNVRLRLYAAKKVKLNTSDNKYYASETIRKVDGIWYYADTLTYDNNNNRNVVKAGYTEEYTGSDIPVEGNYGIVQTEVVQITGPLCLGAWTVEDRDFNNVPGTDIGKTFEHWCIGDIDFGGYFSGENLAIGMKHQGNSTMNQRKRGYRYTFYKNATFAKKDKIKIGEMLRLSGYNMKAYAQDPSRIKEPILYRLFRQIWQERPITDRYDWDNKVNGLFHGATGTCLGFPVTFNVAGEFYGFYVFLIKKDEKNYMLNGEDESGIFVSGSTNSNFAWGRYLPYSITENYDEEMLDEMSESTIKALENWHHFINGRLYLGSDENEYNSTELTNVDGTMYVTSTLEGGQVVQSSVSAELIPFDEEHIPDRLDVLGFIDYFINMQVFTMSDNCHNNIIFYSNSEKKKLWPFFYDLDGTILTQYGADADIMNPSVTWCSDMSLWENLLDMYWDSVANRYFELRRTILTIDNIKSIYKDIVSEIPEDVYPKERNKWGSTFAPDTFDTFITFLEQRFNYLDNHYFSRGKRIQYN